jgi:polar amino acid transport system ATP-binding protein
LKLLEIRNLRKCFGDLKVIKDFSMEVDEGQVVAVIGPSGSGKSTLLRCATLLEKIDSGELLYDGEKIATTDQDGNVIYVAGKEARKAQKFSGLVFQNFNLFPHFSVIRNIIDPLICVHRVSKEKALEIGRELLKKMALLDKEKAYPCQLSGGQQQRVSIARALALSPRVLFFDEPTSALDPELTGEVLKVIKDLAAENMTMVIVTHEMSFARDVADHVIFMDGGVIVEQGPPDKVINNPENERTKAFMVRFQE